ncbi:MULTISPECIES: hypothetical protein [unclassified Blastococcus]
MTRPDEDPPGDYGYDLAHDVPASPPPPRRPERPATTAPPHAEHDRRGDASYDEAHDF